MTCESEKNIFYPRSVLFIDAAGKRKRNRVIKRRMDIENEVIKHTAKKKDEN